MGWRFRRSFKVIPGVRLNLSRRGLSATIGASPFSMNLSARGPAGTVSVPGTGLSYRHQLTSPKPSTPTLESPTFPQPVPIQPASPSPAPASDNGTEIRSASTELLTTGGLVELKRLIEDADAEQRDITNELAGARHAKNIAVDRHVRWEKGFLFKRIFQKAFAERASAAEESIARFEELEEQLRLTTIATQIDIEKEQAEPYYRMRDEFAALTECKMIWDATSERSVNRFVERTVAARKIDRKPVHFALKDCDLIRWDQKVPHLENANGGDLYVYPGFILYRASAAAFSLLDLKEVQLAYRTVGFIEDGPVPSDARIEGQTWLKANKDGSRDKRFADNRQIPIAAYGQLVFTSGTGLNEEYQCSNAALAQRFCEAWQSFNRSLTM